MTFFRWKMEVLVSPDKVGEGEDPLEKGVLHFVVSSKELSNMVGCNLK